MRLIIVGSEYAGKTTLVNKIVDWRDEMMGPPIPLGIVRYHDHFTLPWVGHWDEISEIDLKKFMELGPELKEMFQRYQFSYHMSNLLYRDSDHILVGFHIEEAVYAPRYYGYGAKGEYADRERMARSIELEIMEQAPDTVLVFVKASPKIIADRMKKTPHKRTVLKPDDIDETIEAFEQHVSNSLLRYKITLDTSNSPVADTMAEFVEKIEPHLSQSDRLRIQTHTSLKRTV